VSAATSGGRKIGNAQLRWTFDEAACLFLRASARERELFLSVDLVRSVKKSRPTQGAVSRDDA
jgi:hypothetical protein